MNNSLAGDAIYCGLIAHLYARYKGMANAADNCSEGASLVSALEKETRLDARDVDKIVFLTIGNIGQGYRQDIFDAAILEAKRLIALAN